MKKVGIIVSAAVLCLMASSCFKEVQTTTGGTGIGGIGGADINTGLLAYYTFDGQDGTDYSGNDLTGIAYSDQGSPSYGAGVRGMALHIVGMKGDNFRIPYNLFNRRQSWTVSFWAKDIIAGVIFAGQNDNFTSNHDLPMLMATQNGVFAFKSEDAFTGISYNYINATGWHHYVLCVSNATGNYNTVASLKFYVDGVLTDNLAPTYNASYVNTCTRVVFGGDKGGIYGMAASFWIDEVRFYGRTLSAREVVALYNAEK